MVVFADRTDQQGRPRVQNLGDREISPLMVELVND
jgi:hypothetical protein